MHQQIARILSTFIPLFVVNINVVNSVWNCESNTNKSFGSNKMEVIPKNSHP